MSLSFFKAEEKDISTIAALADRIWNKHYITIITQEQIDYMLQKMYSEKSLLEQMKQGQEFTIVKENNNPIGYISLSKKNDSEYFLHKFYIEVSEQNKGVGSELFKYILMQYPGARSIELTVNRQNYKAINFYFKHGFRIKEVADFDIGNDYFMNDFVMIKKID